MFNSSLQVTCKLIILEYFAGQQSPVGSIPSDSTSPKNSSSGKKKSTPKRRSTQIPRLVDNKRSHREKALSQAQHDQLLLNSTKEDVIMKREMMAAFK